MATRAVRRGRAAEAARHWTWSGAGRVVSPALRGVDVRRPGRRSARPAADSAVPTSGPAIVAVAPEAAGALASQTRLGSTVVR